MEIGRHKMKIRETSEYITNWGNSVLSSKANSEEESTQKDEEKGKIGTGAEATREARALATL